jgi:PKD repeat protein
MQKHDVLCFGENNGSVNMTTMGGTPPYSFSWSLNGQTSEDIEDLCPGIYTVTISDSLNCSTIKQVIIEEPDLLKIEASPDVTICIGESAELSGNAFGGIPPYTYEWIGIGSTQSITMSPIIATSYFVKCTDSNHCKSDTASVTIYLYPPTSSFTTVQDDTICFGDSTYIFANFSGGNGGLYSCFINGEEKNIPVYVKPDTTVIYTIFGYDDCGSPALSSSVTIVVMMPPRNSFTSDISEGCEPLEVNFFKLNPGENQLSLWRFEEFDGLHYSYDLNPTHVYETSGFWDVSVAIVTSFGCEFTIHYPDMISVYPKPDANFLADPQIVSRLDPIIFFDNLSYPIVDCYWNFGDGTTDTGHLNGTSHIYSDTGQFFVTLIAENDYNCRDTLTLPVRVEGDVTEFYAPNAFNPNSSTLENRVFKPSIYGLDLDHYHLIIYNRWGEPIFETFDYYRGWDGRVKNRSIAAIGAYPWLVSYRDLNGKPRKETGSVMVIDK